MKYFVHGYYWWKCNENDNKKFSEFETIVEALNEDSAKLAAIEDFWKNQRTNKYIIYLRPSASDIDECLVAVENPFAQICGNSIYRRFATLEDALESKANFIVNLNRKSNRHYLDYKSKTKKK